MAVAVARARPRSTRRTAPTRRVAGGAVWIVVMAVLLAGVVALNVAVLRLNLRFDEMARERDQLRAEQAELASMLATRAASTRTASLARREGYVPADQATTTYLDLGKR